MYIATCSHKRMNILFKIYFILAMEWPTGLRTLVHDMIFIGDITIWYTSILYWNFFSFRSWLTYRWDVLMTNLVRMTTAVSCGGCSHLINTRPVPILPMPTHSNVWNHGRKQSTFFTLLLTRARNALVSTGGGCDTNYIEPVPGGSNSQRQVEPRFGASRASFWAAHVIHHGRGLGNDVRPVARTEVINIIWEA